MDRIKNITIVGTGNVGSHLAKSFSVSKIKVNGIFSRNSENAQSLANTFKTDVIERLDSIKKTDLVLICVPDDVIIEVIKQLPKSLPVAYTSGSVKLDELPKRDRLGVFYPLQTFSKKRNLYISNVPFLIESDNNEFGERLFQLAEQISSKVLYADSNDRYQLHIAAVMVNNFTNHIYDLADEHVKSNDLDFDLLIPLIKETVDKLNTLSPFEAQTGPAKRGDLNVINKHINSLKGETKDIYSLLSESILRKFGNK
tara:strand:+ start:11238 stop:12005 length:768 start_codon:yes stop_codon:yes gene_type:complete